MSYVEATKKSQGANHNEINEEPIIISQPNSRKCPVASFRPYLSKLTESKELFQLPNPYFKIPKANWYKKILNDVGSIGSFMKENSRAAGFSYIYTNHCT